MNFSSPFFLFAFLPLVLLTYWVADSQRKVWVGIVASIVFYVWGNGFYYLFLLVAVIVTNYLFGLWISHSSPEGKKRTWVMIAVLVLNVALLVFFKWQSTLAFPIGLSFIIFSTIAYIVEVYKRTDDAEKNFGAFAYFILLFPKIIVGPITRYSKLRNQIANPVVTPQGVSTGIRRFIKGFAKKALIADTLAKIVTPVFNLQPNNFSTGIAWLALICYAIQLFYDFSGYTDMAIGLGQMLGLQFLENFNFPYISKSITEFWRRWHISLSSWFRDFVFFPLARKRIKFLGQHIVTLIVFLLTGLWHGFTLTFMVWGLIHGSAIVFENTAWGRKFQQAWAPVRHLYSLSIILIGWVFFRAPSLDFAAGFLARLVGLNNQVVQLPFSLTKPLPIIDHSIWLALAVGILFSLPIAPVLQKRVDQFKTRYPAAGLPVQIVYDMMLFFLLIASVAAIASGSYTPSLYGRF